MKAIDAVANLRKLADLLEKHGDVEIRMTSALVWVNDKESFLALAGEFPRPFTKGYGDLPHGDLELTHGKLSEAGLVSMYVPRSAVCELVEPARPAVYRCLPLLPADEEAELAPDEETSNA